jgi:hypothetical protein
VDAPHSSCSEHSLRMSLAGPAAASMVQLPVCLQQTAGAEGLACAAMESTCATAYLNSGCCEAAGGVSGTKGAIWPWEATCSCRRGRHVWSKGDEAGGHAHAVAGGHEYAGDVEMLRQGGMDICGAQAHAEAGGHGYAGDMHMPMHPLPCGVLSCVAPVCHACA